MKGLNALQLKIFMALLMVLDHLHKIPGLLSGDTILLFHMITRVVGVWFAYLSVEGFLHTKNRLQYNGRLFFYGLIMMIGNTVMNLFFGAKGIFIENNIFLTLAMGVLFLNILFHKEWLCFGKRTKLESGLRALLGLGVFLIGFFFTEGGMVILPFIWITYAFRHQQSLRNASYLLLSVFLFVLSYVPYETVEETFRMLAYNSEFLFIFVLPFLYLYNGERGSQKKFAKYFFYWFYPIHLWVIAIIAYFTV